MQVIHHLHKPPTIYIHASANNSPSSNMSLSSIDFLHKNSFIPGMCVSERKQKSKIALLTFMSLHTIVPSYLSSLIRPYIPSRALRSSSAHRLCVPHVSTVFGSRGFRSAGPAIWNSLPLSVSSCSTIHTFKKQLNTHLFASAFPSS